ncbi:ABC transporter substrate-binding protein [Subtercola endophyticus]|uniref:ABC transporter substrate-binding protein n=1 Tax=Subtercola endophyticus TaxID=2895559 RepID=UPI001E3D8F2F|nr:ABC transporter substrate-binding protein [Subtercola endophyticus]UFS58281.1 ABC transporter substrate-binding protein [Subtercola endophyticus]
MSFNPLRLKRRWAVAASVVTIAALTALTGCSGSSSDASSTGDTATPVAGGTLKLAFWDDQQGCIDPNQVYWIESRSIDRQIADSLTDQDPDTGKIVPWLATSWTTNDNATQFTFTLRDGVTFSDGEKFDATAVKTALDATYALGAKSLLGVSYLAGYDSTTVIDPTHVQVNFKTPNAAFLQATSTTTLAILAPKTYQETPEARCAGAIIGSGAFTLDNYTAATSAHLTKRADYAWPSSLVKNEGAAYLDAIDVTYIKEDSVRNGELSSGQIDIAWPRLPISDADQQVLKAAGDTIETRALPGISYVLTSNITGTKPLSDPLVRQALQKAIDRPTYASTVFWADYPVVKSPVESTTPFATDESSLLAFDLDGAKKLLDQAGWAVGPDGYRYKNGQKLTLDEPLTTSGAGDQLLQDQLKQAGIDLTLDVVTTAQYTQKTAAGDYDLVGTYYTRADPSVLGSVFDQALTKAPTAVNSQDAATAATISADFAKGLQTTDDTQRAAAYADLQKTLITAGVTFPLYERLQVSAVSPKVHGFAFTSEAFLRANDIWLEQ